MEEESFKRRPNELSLSRVKTIMKSSPDAENVSQESVYLITKATELFIKYMVEEAYKENSNTKSLEYKHVSELVQTREELAFLREIVPRKCTLRDIEDNLRRRGLETKRPGVSSSSSDLSLYSDEDLSLSPEPKDTTAEPPFSLLHERNALSSACSPELTSSKPVTVSRTNSSLVKASLSEDEFVLTKELETSSGVDTYLGTSSTLDVVLRPGTPSTITLSSSSREMSFEGSPSPTSSFLDPVPACVAVAASPLSVMSVSSGSRTPSPSPSYSSLSPQFHSIIPVQDEFDMVTESVESVSSDSSIYEVEQE
jgi:chromatin accessibility complex protein 1